MIEFVFGSALFINALLFVPQAIKIFKEKTSHGVSLLTFFGFFVIQFAIVLHGIINRDYLFTLGYLLSMITCGAVVVLALFYKKQEYFQNEEKISFNEILEQLPEHIYWKNKKGIWLGCNSNNWKDFGLKSPNDYIGKTDFDLFSKEQANKIRQADLEVIDTGQPKTFEEEITTIEGKTILYLSHKIPLRNDRNQIIGIIGVSVDITDARKKEIERLEFLESIIAVMPGHVYWVNKDNVYLGCNDNQAKSAGLASRKEIIGKRNIDIPGFLIPEALDPVNKNVMESGKAIFLVEEPAILADGTKATFLSNKVPLFNKQGEVIGMVGISFDITEKKRMERELQETRHKLEGMTLVGASIAHELRTPLASINMGIENIKIAFSDFIHVYELAKKENLPLFGKMPNFKILQAVLDSMEAETKAAYTFTEMLLMNVNPSLDDNQREIFSIVTCINDALARYPFKKGQRELIHWDDKQYEFLVKGNPLFIVHVLFNLIKNAIYYLAASRKKKDEIKIEIWLEPGKTYNKLYFKDTGTGISPEILPHIFDRFFSKTHRGAGIGLTFCKLIMESLGGEIRCTSVEGGYTQFMLAFPREIGNN